MGEVRLMIIISLFPWRLSDSDVKFRGVFSFYVTVVDDCWSEAGAIHRTGGISPAVACFLILIGSLGVQ